MTLTAKKIIKLPLLLSRKIYKTGQTRGADDDQIFQNRVSRNGTVLIPFTVAQQVFSSLNKGDNFENGFIVLISPKQFFENPLINNQLSSLNLTLGVNLLIFYEERCDWNLHPPEKYNYCPATTRVAPLGGQYVARIPGTTSSTNQHKIALGFHTTKPKGAGIRYYEYASKKTIDDCRTQLEALFWLCYDSVEIAINNGMTESNTILRRDVILDMAHNQGLLEHQGLIQSRITNKQNQTICPLCLEKLSAIGFFSKMAQAEGRDVSDLTITQLNLFHINELKLGELNHSTYNLGWGHHHCNVVVKDAGIIPTLNWMSSVVSRNKDQGYL